MKKQMFIGLSFLLILTLLFNYSLVIAQAGSTPSAQPQVTPAATVTETIQSTTTTRSMDFDPEKPLCPPGVYRLIPSDCLPLGPSQTLTDLASKGLTLPLKPIAASKPDPALVNLDKQYAKLNLAFGQQATFYPNAESAEAGVNWIGQLQPGTLQWLSYKSATSVNSHNYVIMEKGEWVRASPSKYSSFQGLLFNHPPITDFGWIVDATHPSISPDYNANLQPEELPRETVVQVYDQVTVNGRTWYMVGLGRWVEERYIRVVDVKAEKPQGVDNERWIVVNLLQQTLTVYDEGKLVFATIIATGVEPFYTRPGLFKVTEKKEFETMTGAFEPGKIDYYYLQDVPWTMYFDQKRALHGAYWRTLFGYEQSHGCVNISVGDAHWLYDWANVGDWVYVWDPSGKTPTDPSFYGEGGA